jgi:tRNA threonylcarbamoyladenosine biosynthesis protein TsaE
MAEGLKAPTASVSSPTFVLIHEYRGRLPLIHADLYRLRAEAEAGSIGLEDYFTDQAVVAIEWADRFPGLLPRDRLEINLSHRSPAARTARLCAQGPRSLRLLSRVRRARRSAQRSPVRRRTNASRRRKALNR